MQIPINGMSRVLRKLNIDAAPAMVGWDFSGKLPYDVLPHFRKTSLV